MSENNGDPTRSGGSFEERLRTARGQRGLDRSRMASDQAASTGSPSALGIGFRVGAELVAALVVAVAIGWALDHWLHTMPLFLAVFVLLGGAAGVLNVWRVFAPTPERKGPGSG
jgi:ATP synthase protein I